MLRNYKKKGMRSGEVTKAAMSVAIFNFTEIKLSFRGTAANYGGNAQTLKSRTNILHKSKDCDNRFFH